MDFMDYMDLYSILPSFIPYVHPERAGSAYRRQNKIFTLTSLINIHTPSQE